jgi:RHS repeat-associated protein
VEQRGEPRVDVASAEGQRAEPVFQLGEQYSRGHFGPLGSAVYYDDNFQYPNPPWIPPGNGVTMADGWIVASYNALNQPVAMGSSAYWGTPNWVWFGYDPLGRCVKRWVGLSGTATSNPATYFYYDGWNLVQEGASAFSAQRAYVHGARMDEIVASVNYGTGQLAYHHYDARGHCTLLTDANANILEQYDYDAFGFPYFYDRFGTSLRSYEPHSQSWLGNSPYGNRFLFTGREWLSDLKLYDYRNRMYQPELGRFLQPDQKQFAASDYNLYRYCHNDPINKSDPTGLDTYQQNRDFDSIGGGVHFFSNYFIATHSFTFTTNPDKSIAHNYSWGNTQNGRGWNLDRPIDIKAAQDALKSGIALNKVGDSKLDPYVTKAFDAMNKKENEHQNFGVARNCKWEATDLLHKAKEFQKQDEKGHKENDKKSEDK